MQDYTSGKIVKFDDRLGGYLNFCSDREHEHTLTQENAAEMLKDFNAVLSKYFPWMKDFVVFQLQDQTIRLDVADRQFLGAGGVE